MLPKEKIFELMKEAGLDEQKFYQLLLKADPSFAELSEKDLDHVNGGFIVFQWSDFLHYFDSLFGNTRKD